MLALLLALQAAPGVDSLPRITLREALERAARLDPNYVAALGQVDNAAWARRNAFAVFVLPAVTVGVNAQRSNPPGFFFAGDTFFVVKTNWASQLSARYDLFTGGQKLAELARSGAALAGARAEELRQRFATALLTESDYYAVLANAELDRVARERLRRAREQLGVARARVVSGAAVSTDSLNLRLELTRAQVAQLEQQSALRVARLQLGRRIGAAGPVDAMPLDTAAPPQLPISLPDAIAEAARQGPEYRVAAADERAASAAFRAELGSYLPHAALTFNAFGFDTAFYPNLFKQTNFTLSVSFPLWNNGQRELALSRARVTSSMRRWYFCSRRTIASSSTRRTRISFIARPSSRGRARGSALRRICPGHRRKKPRRGLRDLSWNRRACGHQGRDSARRLAERPHRHADEGVPGRQAPGDGDASDREGLQRRADRPARELVCGAKALGRPR